MTAAWLQAAVVDDLFSAGKHHAGGDRVQGGASGHDAVSRDHVLHDCIKSLTASRYRLLRRLFRIRSGVAISYRKAAVCVNRLPVLTRSSRFTLKCSTFQRVRCLRPSEKRCFSSVLVRAIRSSRRRVFQLVYMYVQVGVDSLQTRGGCISGIIIWIITGVWFITSPELFAVDDVQKLPRSVVLFKSLE